MKKSLLLILLSIQVASLLAQAPYTPEIEAQIEQFENSLSGRIKINGDKTYTINKRMAFHNAMGMSIAVIKDYQVIWAKGYGWADKAEKKPVTTETLFEPGSISKSLNAVGILKLVQDQKLDLHTDINTYLSSWTFPYDDVAKGKKITLSHLLSHSAGLTVHGFPGYDLTSVIPSVQQVLDGLPPANTPPVRSAFEPGLKFQYSGGGTTISQLILTDITRQPYDVYMYENVLKPMGMVNSFYSQPPPVEKRPWCASGYYKNGSRVPNKFHVYPEQGAAGLWMTPTDLCQFIIETQLAYEGRSAKVLNQEMTKLQLTPYIDANAAMGVFIDDRNGTLYFQHSAGNAGFCGQFYGSLKGGNGVAVFLNTDSYALIPEVLNSVATVYKWKGFVEPENKSTVKVKEKILRSYIGVYNVHGAGLTHIVKRKDGYFLCADGVGSKMHFSNTTDFFNVEFASEKHFFTDDSGNVTGYSRSLNGEVLPAAIKVFNPDTLTGSEETLNLIGWSLIENHQFEEAIRYLKRGFELYPTSLLIEGNLAHAYLFSGDYQAAKAIYARHMGETIQPGMSWVDMIQQDFVYFKGIPMKTKPMDKVLAELNIDIPPEYN
jgi:CubicO group peptidase (beta-lactamase class C family)